MSETAVVFDLGNVLVRWAPEAALRPLFNSDEDMWTALKAIDFQGWNRLQDGGRDWDEGIRHGAEQHPDHGFVFAAYRDGLAAAHEQTIAGTVDILHELRAAQTPLYAITNASTLTVAVMREMHGFIDLFQDVVVSGDVGLLKPDRAIYEHFLVRSGRTAGACVFIDDSTANVAGAQAVGMLALHFTTPEQLRSDLKDQGLLP